MKVIRIVDKASFVLNLKIDFPSVDLSLGKKL
jgi:hypothetical protein